MATYLVGLWAKSRNRKILVHGCILGGFLLYLLFLANPLFDSLEAMPGEARLTKMELPGETNNVHYYLERYVSSESALEIHGWAFIEGHNTDNSKTFIVLKSNKTTYVFETFTVFYPYVTAQYQESNLNLDWSGFITTIPARKIESGDYTLGVYITRDGTQALQYTSRLVVKAKDKIKLT